MLIALHSYNYIRMILIFWLFLFAFLATDFTWKCLAAYAQNVNNEITELIAIDSKLDDDDPEHAIEFLNTHRKPISPSLNNLSRRDYVPDTEHLKFSNSGLLLVATVDGALHGVEASTGTILWSQKDLGIPLVTSDFIFKNRTLGDAPSEEELSLDEEGSFDTFEELGGKPLTDDIYYLPEPGGDGNLYYTSKNNQLRPLTLSIKKLVEEMPFSEYGRRYTASKKSSFVTINPMNGAILNHPNSTPLTDSVPSTYFSYGINSNSGALVVGLTDYEVEVIDSLTNNLIWTVTFREFISDKKADIIKGGPNDVQKVKSILNVNAFASPVIYAFDVLIEENIATPKVKHSTLVARSLNFSELEIPSGISINSQNGSAFLGRHRGSFYVLSSKAFPYMSLSKFSELKVSKDNDKQMVMAYPHHLYQYDHDAIHIILPIDQEENETNNNNNNENEESKYNWRRVLWFSVGTILAICGYKELENNQLFKKVDESRKKAKSKNNKKNKEDKDHFKVSGPVKAQYKEDGSTIINTITVFPEVLGYGSHGTIVYKGQFQGRDVAVKRMLKDLVQIAEHEVNTLEDSDSHPNVVRYYCMERCEQFMYLALELCPTSLYGLIQDPSKLSFKCAITPQDMLYQIMVGLHHLHSLKIVHRDIKPHNILIACNKDRFGQDRPPRVLISDFGLCKKLEEDQSSFHNTLASGAAAGTMGWRAPEILMNSTIAKELSDPALLNEHSSSSNLDSSSSSITLPPPLGEESKKSKGRITRAVDIFSAGCVFYYVLTNGQHPFGGKYARESRVIEGKSELIELLNNTDIEFKAEAHDLITQMIHPDPAHRPDSGSVLIHPYFWGANKKLAFLQDISDQLEAEAKTGYRGERLEDIEIGAELVIGEDWQKRMDNRVLNDLHRYRGYDGSKLKDLLRVIRNKKHHYQDLPNFVKRAYGPLPEGYLNYFLNRYPRLLLHAYYTLAKHPTLSKDPIFKTYFQLNNGLNN
ncbi:kinase-like protein [Neoconidiobolus thromboides FSU 785]|nr:kinase-like protein [Neoconidiobolus thromboides FSU 785]